MYTMIMVQWVYKNSNSIRLKVQSLAFLETKKYPKFRQADWSHYKKRYNSTEQFSLSRVYLLNISEEYLKFVRP